MMNIQMPQKIGVIGHDLVGAMRGIEVYANYRVTPTVVIDGEIPENLSVIAVTAMSKIATPHMAYLKTRKAISKCNGRYLYFYENGLLMGNISADIKAIVDELKPEKLVICMAWPELNVRTIGACSYLGNTLAHNCIKASDAVTPIKESYIPAIVEKYTGLVSKCITLEEVERGPDYISRLVNSCREPVIVFDAAEPHHVESIAEAVVLNKDSWVPLGYRGLIQSLPPLLGYKKQTNVLKPLPNKNPVLLVLGSLGDVSALQLTIAAERGMIYPILVDPSDLWSKKKREYKIEKLASEAIKQASNGNNVALTSTCSRFIPQFQRITAYLLSSIAKLILEEKEIGAVFTRGADTSYAFCKTMEIQKLEIKGNVPSAGRLPAIVKGYTKKGMIYWQCLLGGLSGDALTIVRALRFLRQS